MLSRSLAEIQCFHAGAFENAVEGCSRVALHPSQNDACQRLVTATGGPQTEMVSTPDQPVGCRLESVPAWCGGAGPGGTWTELAGRCGD